MRLRPGNTKPSASWEPATSAVPGGFSKQNKVLAKTSRFPSGICVFHSSMAAFRVLLDIPLLALKSCVGSTEMVITGPLANAFTKG